LETYQISQLFIKNYFDEEIPSFLFWTFFIFIYIASGSVLKYFVNNLYMLYISNYIQNNLICASNSSMEQ
jgi:hypothetical protein